MMNHIVLLGRSRTTEQGLFLLLDLRAPADDIVSYLIDPDGDSRLLGQGAQGPEVSKDELRIIS